MKNWSYWTKKELLKLPARERDKKSVYDSILLVNTCKKHESGYNLFAIIGCKSHIPIEIAGHCDSFNFSPFEKNGNFTDSVTAYDMKFDCSMRGVFRMHGNKKICVGMSGSTTCFWLEERKEEVCIKAGSLNECYSIIGFIDRFKSDPIPVCKTQDETQNVPANATWIYDFLRFLKDGFVAYDKDFGWVWYKNEPIYGDCEIWLSTCYGITDCEMLFLSKYFNIRPPKCNPEDSLIKVVNGHEVQNAANA